VHLVALGVVLLGAVALVLGRVEQVQLVEVQLEYLSGVQQYGIGLNLQLRHGQLLVQHLVQAFEGTDPDRQGLAVLVGSSRPGLGVDIDGLQLCDDVDAGLLRPGLTVHAGLLRPGVSGLMGA
jgi:hypothetical protein